MRITGGINGTLMRGNDEEFHSRTDVSRRCCHSALKETCRQLQEKKREEKVKGGGGGGRILNEASISVHHRQTNVTDRNGSRDASANCALVNSLATAGRRVRVGETSQEQP